MRINRRYAPYKRVLKERRVIEEKEAVPVLYAFQTHSCVDCDVRDSEIVFKVGKTINLEQRIRSYRTLNPEGKVLFSIECKDIHSAEKWLHDILRAQGLLVKSEVFKVKPSVLIELMTFVSRLNDFFQSRKSNLEITSLVSSLIV